MCWPKTRLDVSAFFIAGQRVRGRLSGPPARDSLVVEGALDDANTGHLFGGERDESLAPSLWLGREQTEHTAGDERSLSSNHGADPLVLSLLSVYPSLERITAFLWIL